MNFTFGCDPEFILADDQGSVSAVEKLPQKDESIVVDGNHFYCDNALAEIAIGPLDSKEALLESTRNAIKFLINQINPLMITNKSYDVFADAQLVNRESNISRYNPEWSIYDLEEIAPPNIAEIENDYVEYLTNTRTAGGHIHLGSEILFQDLNSIMAIKMMDLFIAIPSLFLDKHEDSKQRRMIYGQAGSHRLPKHGIEYRVLSNFWMMSPKYVDLVYDLCKFVLEFVANHDYERFWVIDLQEYELSMSSSAFNCFGYDVKKLIKCINECDQKEAEKFMYFISNFLPQDLYSKILELQNLELTDIKTNWSI
jgi:hypothetical protein